ncbi:MAG: helix-turn-helix domain-containing protein [Rhodospirillales bacterium]|nr:helix-turn-helix domain-containing protein [Rhodospirillales bacterium]
MAMLYMRQGELADRWGISERTLEKWRHFGRGPSFLKIGGRVMYRRDDIENSKPSRFGPAPRIAAVSRRGATNDRRHASGRSKLPCLGERCRSRRHHHLPRGPARY